MKYIYNYTEEELKRFGGILKLENNYDEGAPDMIMRGEQDSDKTYDVFIQTQADMLLLLDYLSYDKSKWDYEPRIRIHLGGNVIEFQRRGNYGHIHALQNGDMVIVDNYVRQCLTRRFTPKETITQLAEKSWEEINNATADIGGVNLIDFMAGFKEGFRSTNG
jgi:hypothetical protein